MARVLIVEDDRFFANVLARTLGLDGHEVTVANSACEGVWRGLTHRPDVVVAAWWLKGKMHGGEVCRRIRDVWPYTRNIIVTGHPECVAEAGRYQDCVETVLLKPFHKNDILEAVRRTSVGKMRLAPSHLSVSQFQESAV